MAKVKGAPLWRWRMRENDTEENRRAYFELVYAELDAIDDETELMEGK